MSSSSVGVVRVPGDALVVRPQHANRLQFGGGRSSSHSLAAALQHLGATSDTGHVALNACVIAACGDGAIGVAYGDGLCVVGVRGGVRAFETRVGSSSSARSPANSNSPRGDPVTAMCWIQATPAESTASTTSASPSSAAGSSEWILLVGFSSGLIRAYQGSSGTLLFTQRLQEGAVRRLRLRRPRTGRLVTASSAQATSDLLVLYPGALAWVDGRSLASSLRDALADAATAALRSHDHPGADLLASASAYPWSFRAWAHAAQTAEDVLAVEPMPDDPFLGAAAAPHKPDAPCYLAAGADPALAYFSPEEEDSPVSPSGRSGSGRVSRSYSTRGTIKLVASKLTSAVFSMAKTWWNSDGPPRSEEEAVEALPQPDEVEMERCIRDGTRQVVRLAPDPLLAAASAEDQAHLAAGACTYAVAADNFGRVSLIDLQAFVIVRMWKGYRDAQCCLVRQPYISADADAPTPAAASRATPTATAGANTSSKASSKRGKVSIVSHSSSDFDENDPFKDFDSMPTPTTTHSQAAAAPTASTAIDTPSAATLSTRAPVGTRAAPTPLHMLLYAPRRGQLELWSLPYGARVGARNVGMGCVLLSGATSGSDTCARLLRPDGTVQTVQIAAPTLPRAPTPVVELSPLDAETAADAECIADAESRIIVWSRQHAHSCGGFACGEASAAFESVVAPLAQLSKRLADRVPPPSDSSREWTDPPCLDDEHVARVSDLLRAAGKRMLRAFGEGSTTTNTVPSSSSSSAAVAPPLCPRLCESVLQATLRLLDASLHLASPSGTGEEDQEIEIRIEDEHHETTITITRPSLVDETETAARDATGWHVRAATNNLLQAAQLKQIVHGALHLLAVYHTSCAPAGRDAHGAAASSDTASSVVTSRAHQHGLSLLHFLDCFRARVFPRDDAKTKSKPADVPAAAAASAAAVAIAAPAKTGVSCTVRFTFNDALTAALSTPRSSAHAASSPVVSLALLLFGPTSATAFPTSDFLAAKCLDLLLHLDACGLERRALVALWCDAWFTMLPVETVLHPLLTDRTSEWDAPREQLRLLMDALCQPPTDGPFAAPSVGPSYSASSIAALAAFLSTGISWAFHSCDLEHVSALLRLVRTFVVRPRLEATRAAVTLREERRRDGEFIAEPPEELNRASDFLDLVDASTRVLFRHLCQLRFVRTNFPATTVRDSDLTLHRFVASHPLSRLVAQHLLRVRDGANGGAMDTTAGSPVPKEEVRAKLCSFESVLASGDVDAPDVATGTTDLIAVATLLATRTPEGDASAAAIRAQTTPLPASAWDWSLTSDDASCYIYASLASLQRFFASAPAAPHDLSAAVAYLEYAPPSAASGGLAVLLWREVLAPHVRALVHAAYPDPPTPVVPERPSSSASSLAAVNAAAAAAKAKKVPPTFLKTLKALYAAASTGSPSPNSAAGPLLVDFSDLETLRAVFSLSHRVLAYVRACFAREEKDQAWEGDSNYFCPAIAQTLDASVPHAVPIRQADQQRRKRKSGDAAAAATAATVTAGASLDRYLSALVHPADGPPSTAAAPALCTSLFHAHVRYTHPESTAPYTNLPSPLYARLVSSYQETDLDRTMTDLMRMCEVLSAHVELDLVVSNLAASQASVGHMFPSHPLVRDAQALKCLAPRMGDAFPRIATAAAANARGIDVVEWICGGSPLIDVPVAPKAPTPSSVPAPTSKFSPPPLALVPLAAVPTAAARLSFLLLVLKDRPSLSTAPMVFGLSDVLCLSPSAHEALLREHVLLLYERGEDARAWECVPRLDDGACVASVLIAVGRTRLGLFLHALEAKNAGKYAQLVSAVPAQAWQWLAKAKPPHVMSKVTQEAASSGESRAASSGAAPPTYILSGTPRSPTAPYDPLHLVLTRIVAIKQKASDIDIHATLTLLRRAKAMLEQSLAAQRPPSSTTPVAAVQGEPFGRDADNGDEVRQMNPLRYARAYASQLVDIAAMVVRGIGGR